MNPVLAFLLGQPLACLFLMIALGLCVGRLGWRGIQLGDSGVLFVAMGLGALGATIPAGVGDLGVVLFLYTVGLQAGPRFFRSLRGRAVGYLTMAGVTLGTAAFVLVGCQRLFELERNLSVGLFVGALTSTPGLATSLEALDGAPGVSVGYGIAYPFGAVAMVLFAQIVPKLLGVDLRKLATDLDEAERPPEINAAWYRVANPQLVGRTIGELIRHRLPELTISRVAKVEKSFSEAAEPGVTLALNDHVRVVARDDKLALAETILGPREERFTEPTTDLTIRELGITADAIAGKTLAELAFRQRYGVVVSRLWRDEFELVASGTTRLEVGDTIRIVGSPEACNRLADVVGHEDRRIQETRFLPLALGLIAGILLGSIPIPLGETTVRLGSAGGPLFTGLIAGHFGRIGPFSFRMPIASRLALRQLGLCLFLASAGTLAGQRVLTVLLDQGPTLILAAILTATIPMIVAYTVAVRLLKFDQLTGLGALCGAMTSTPGLGAVASASGSERPTLAYASAYPAALVFVILLAQGLVAVFEPTIQP